MPKTIVGIVEDVTLEGDKKVKTYAVFDTGARLTSIDVKLASRANVGPVVRTARVKNPSLKTQIRRPVVRVGLKIKGKKYECEANLQDRSHMTAPMLIGRNILVGNFIVDPAKNLKRFNKMRKRKDSPEALGLKSIMEFGNGGAER